MSAKRKFPTFDPATFAYQPYADIRGETPDAEPILFIEYGKDGKWWWPSIVQTTESGYGFTYCHGGEISKDDGCAHHFDDRTGTLELPVYWEDGRKTRTPIWINPAYVKVLKIKGELVTRRQARRFRFLAAPIVYTEHADNPVDRFTPINDSEEMNYKWCNVCRDYFASERECCHLRYQEGGEFAGCGSNDMDLSEAQRSLYELLEVLPPEVVTIITNELRGGRPEIEFGREWDLGDVGVGKWPNEIEIDKDALALEEGAKKRYWPGMCWLSSLDKRATEAVALTRGWLWQWQQQQWKGTCVLHEHILHYQIPAKEFDAWFVLDPNDAAGLATRTLTVDFKTLRKQGGCVNTINFLKDPSKAPAAHLSVADRGKSEDYRSLRYRVGSVKHDRKQAILSFARCLDNNGTHPSFLPGYEIVSDRQLEWIRRPKTKKQPNPQQKTPPPL